MKYIFNDVLLVLLGAPWWHWGAKRPHISRMPSASSDCASCCVKHNLQSGYWVHIVYCEVWKWASVRFCTYQHPVCVHFIEMLHICNSKSLPVVCWVCGGFSVSLFKVKERRGLKKVRQFHTRGFIFFQLDISLFWCITVKKKKNYFSRWFANWWTDLRICGEGFWWICATSRSVTLKNLLY